MLVVGKYVTFHVFWQGMLAELTMNDQKSYIDVIDVMTFDDDCKITSMKAYWSPMEMRPTR